MKRRVSDSGGVCKKCKVMKPAPDFYPKHAKCKKCVLTASAVRSRRWRLANAGRIQAYRLKNRAKYVANCTRWKKSNPERTRELGHKYQVRNINSLTDGYVRSTFAKLISGPALAALPAAVLKIKRQHLQLHRIMKGAKSVLRNRVNEAQGD